jgi:signal peptidase II
MARRAGPFQFTAVTGGVLMVDAASKAAARLLPDGGWRAGPVLLQRGYNPGGAFGLAPHLGPLLGLAAVLFVTASAVAGMRARPAAVNAALALMCGGAAGNLLDRFTGPGRGVLGGAVTDWVSVRGYPFSFNVADVGLRAGALVLLVHAVRSGGGGWLGLRQENLGRLADDPRLESG